MSVVCYLNYRLHATATISGNEDQVMLDGNAHDPQVILLNTKLFT